MLHNENSRVKIPALVHFTRLEYEYLSLKNYTGKDLIDEDTNIFIDLLCAAINRINGVEYIVYLHYLLSTTLLETKLKQLLQGRNNETLPLRKYMMLMSGFPIRRFKRK